MKFNNLNKDIIIGLSFFAGVFNFMSGEFIFSTMLFGFASIASNFDFGAPAPSNC